MWISSHKEYRYIAVVIWTWAGETQLQQDWALNISKTAALHDVSGLLGYIHGVASGKGWEPPSIMYSGVLTREELSAKWDSIKRLRRVEDPLVDAYKTIYREIAKAMRRQYFHLRGWQGCMAELPEERLLKIVADLEIPCEELAGWCQEVEQMRKLPSLFKWFCRNLVFDIVDFSNGGLREPFQAPFLRLAQILADPELNELALDEEFLTSGDFPQDKG